MESIFLTEYDLTLILGILKAYMMHMNDIESKRLLLELTITEGVDVSQLDIELERLAVIVDELEKALKNLVS